MSHTILLVQASNKDTRQYSDYDTLDEALEAVCHMFEQHLKKTYPKNVEILYDLVQLFEYCDQLTDLSFLVFQRSSHSYAPYDKEWIKEKLYIMLRQDRERELQQTNNENNQNVSQMCQ